MNFTSKFKEKMAYSQWNNELENMFRVAAQIKRNSSTPQKDKASSLKDFVNSERIPTNNSLISWWNTMDINHEYLYKLTTVVHAVPVTQASVKKFSIFRKI